MFEKNMFRIQFLLIYTYIYIFFIYFAVLSNASASLGIKPFLFGVVAYAEKSSACTTLKWKALKIPQLLHNKNCVSSHWNKKDATPWNNIQAIKYDCFCCRYQIGLCSAFIPEHSKILLNCSCKTTDADYFCNHSLTKKWFHIFTECQ